MKLQLLGKFARPVVTVVLLFSLTGCGASFSEKDLAACQSAWDSTSKALLSLPRAAYSETAPDPTFYEVNRHYEDLLSSRTEIIALSEKVDNGELKVALLDFALGTGAMAMEFLDNPRGRGTPGITQFNDAFQSVLDLCKNAGWEN